MSATQPTAVRVIGAETAERAAPAAARLPLVAAIGTTVALLAALLVAGATGDLAPRDLVSRFVAAMERGDARDLERLLHDDPTIVTWIATMPSSRDAPTMTLLDLGLADRVVTADAYPIADYQRFTQLIRTETAVTGCEATAPRPGRQAALYDTWITCHFASENDLTEIATGGQGTQRGRVGFGVADQRVRAVLVLGMPTHSHPKVREFLQWVFREHRDQFETWMRGRFQHPVFSEESAIALRRLAVSYAEVA